MSKTEDYLDGLLNSLEGNEHKNMEPEMPPDESVDTEKTAFAESTLEKLTLGSESEDADQDFLDSFEREFLSGEDTEEFIRQFERELAEEEGYTMPTDSDDMIFEKMDDFAVDNLTVDDFPLDDTSMNDAANDFMVDTLGDISDSLDEPLPGLSDEEAANEEAPESLMDNDEQDLMDLLRSEGDFSDIGDVLGSEEGSSDVTNDFADGLDGFTLEEVPIDDTMVLEDTVEEDTQENKSETSGFLKKISQVLFGEEEEEMAASATVPAKSSAPTTPDLSNLSEDELLLMELEGTGVSQEDETPEEVPETEEEAKERKKREKAEKKAQKKAKRAEEKAQKKAAQAEKNAKKVKKPKKPKEPDNTPPLPKKPVILSFVMAASFLALVLIGTNLFGYSSNMANAEKQFGLGNYEAAYQKVSGLDIKEKDYTTYEKYRVMGTVAGEYNSYQTFMDAALYDMALDSLVRAVGRCEKYAPEAEIYGCTGELEKVHAQASGALAGFGITEEQALELYALEEREDYSVQINAILEVAGYTVD